MQRWHEQFCPKPEPLPIPPHTADNFTGIDREPQSKDYPGFPNAFDYADAYEAWLSRQTDRVASQFDSDLKVYAWLGNVDRPPDQLEERRYELEEDVPPFLQGYREMRAQLNEAEAHPLPPLTRIAKCANCGDETGKPCRCDRPRYRATPAILAMDLVEIDWQAEGFNYVSELRAENKRRMS